MKRGGALRASEASALAALAALGLASGAGCDRASERAPASSGALSPEASDIPGTSAASEERAASAPPANADCCMGKNPCRGRGGCAVPESHDCAGKNACEGRGGCRAHCPR